MPLRAILVPLLVLTALLAPAAGAGATGARPDLALTRADVPGLARSASTAAIVRTALLDPMPTPLRRALVTQGLDARGYLRRRAPRIALGSAGVAPGVARIARAGLAAWAARARAQGRTPVRAILGDRAFVTTARDGRRGSRIEVAFVQGGAMGMVLLRAPDRRIGWRRVALIYARSAVARLRPAGLPVYQRLLSRVPPSGVAPKALALQMFAAAYGRVPGVRLPPGDIGAVQDGTQAFAAVSRYLPTLPAAQRTVILRRAGMSAPAPATATARSAAVPVGDPDFVPNASLQASVNSWAAVYASRLGHPLTLNIVAGYSPGKDQKPGAFADAFPLNASGVYGTGDEVTCRVRLLPNGGASKLPFQVLVLAHETFHCFQFDLRKPDWTFAPAWIGEGSADWAALSVDPVSYATGGGNITAYIRSPTTMLFGRAYDAVGFFGHADEVGGDLWKRIAQVITAPGDTTAAGIAAGSLGTFAESWGSSVWNLPALGADWAASRPLVAPSSIQAPPVVVGGGTAMVAPAWTTRQYFVDGTDPAFADTPLMDVHTGNVHVRLTDGSIDVLDPDRWFCLHGRCTCPKGTEGEPPRSTHLNSAVFIGLSGPDAQADGTLSFRSLDDFCSKKNKPTPPQSRPPSGGGSACGGGCGGSNGDPHMTSFDGTRWDFQAVGEFTLAKSTTDDLEVQVRQEPWTPDGDVTINTALAMRVGGHRVAFYAGESMTLRVDGRAVPLTSAAVPLPGGGRITPIGGDEARVDWPDGTYVRVWSVGSWGVAMLMAPAPARAGALVGLLGNFNGNPADDATTRSGTALPTTVLTDYRGGFRLRYGGFGGSWRITQGQSLFDYAGGQSTATFTNKAFPKKPFGVSDLTAAQRQRAEARCRAFGITDPVLLENCILDVAATGQDGFAQSALEQQAAEAAPTVAWTRMPSLDGQRGDISLAATPDGAVHLAALYPGTPDRVLHSAINADGTQRGVDEVLARRGLGDPRLSVGPGGTLFMGLTAIFQSAGEVPPFPPGATPQDGAYSLTAPPAGTPWSLDAWLANGGFAYAGEAQQAIVPGGRVTVLTTNGYARLVAGVGKTAAAYVDPATNGSCITAIPPAEVTADGAQVWAVWLQDSCDARGLYAAPVSATTAALQAPPMLAPQSVFDSASGPRVEGSEPVITSRPGGGAYVAYATRVQDQWRLMLWRVGTATAIDAGPIAGDPNGVFTSAAPDGTVWVAWLDGGTLRARRTGPDATSVLPGTLAAQAPTTSDSYDWAVAATSRGLTVVAGSRGAAGQVSQTTLAP